MSKAGSLKCGRWWVHRRRKSRTVLTGQDDEGSRPCNTSYSHAMRITVPTIPQYLLTSTSTRPTLSKAAAIDRIATFLDGGNTTIITGAGVSVDSGIRAYRGKDGRYMNPNYKCVQVFV